MNKLKEKLTLNPIMTYIILIAFVIVLSWFLNIIGYQSTYNKISASGEYIQTTVGVENLLSLAGIKYVFSTTVSNFASFTPLSMLIIILIGIGVMEKSGFLKTAITLLTKHSKKITITFVWVVVCILLSIIGDLAYVIMIPLSALLFTYGRRNPLLGIVATFAALTCGSGINLFISSTDSTLLSSTLASARILDSSYSLNTFCFIFIMIIAIILLAIIITQITEKLSIYTVEKFEYKEERKEFRFGKKELRGLIFSLTAGFLYLIVFIYNIIPGLPFSGNLLDNSQTFYIDKLFSYDSFFSNGFVFIITLLFIILGLFYGLGAKSIKNHNDLCDDLGHSLDETGKILVLILFASVIVNIVKKSNMGTVFVASLTNLLNTLNVTGIPLIISLFIIGALATILLPTSSAKWSILSTVAVPLFMNNGLSPEFAQVVFRFGESVTLGITPVFAYFVIYLAYLSKYNQSDKPLPMFTIIKYQLPYVIATGFVLALLLAAWYLTGLPIGIGGNLVI